MKKNANANVNEKLTDGIKHSLTDKTQKPTLDEIERTLDKNKKKKKIDEIDETTTVRDLTKEESILNDIKKNEKKKRTYSDEELKEIISNHSFANDIMSKFNSMINEEAQQFLSKTHDIDVNEIDDDSPNILIKITLIDDRDRMLFKEMLFGRDKFRPIFVNIGDYDFFFSHFDNDQPVFSFNKETFSFFFDNDLEKLKSYMKSNTCSFISKLNHSKIKFDNLIIEILDKKPKKDKVEDKIEDKVEESKDESNIELPKNNSIKTYKVKFTNKEVLFVVTFNPAKIFETYGDNVLSVKVIGAGGYI